MFSQLIFEGIRGPGIEGDIAIDDVSIVEGECMKSDQPANSKWLLHLGGINLRHPLGWVFSQRTICWSLQLERLKVKCKLRADGRWVSVIRDGQTDRRTLKIHPGGPNNMELLSISVVIPHRPCFTPLAPRVCYSTDLNHTPGGFLSQHLLLHSVGDTVLVVSL